MKKIAVFASGSGSNAQNLIEFFQKDPIASVVLVLSNNQMHMFCNAKLLGVDSIVFDKTQLLDPLDVLRQLTNYKVDFIVLAGFFYGNSQSILLKNLSRKL